MRGLRGSAPLCALAALAALASGCGGGGERQDEDEPKGNFAVDVLDASFPRSQRLAEQTELRVRVRNAGSKTIPNLAVTVDGFARRSEQQGLADPSRPVWIIDEGPRGGVTAYTNTWALGKVAAGKTEEFVWKVTPVRAGRYEVKWRVAAGLDGKAKATVAGGDRPAGSFTVNVSREPDQSRVDPDTGNVVEAN
ncbi:MAG: hypothetical protein M3320_06555 [Actinomycetota bacterium]|nr:hypothetical protein [Actinomycetota bacterium]MDQ5808321.1 hypothetical protein [Actinomycetota bacterium]